MGLFVTKPSMISSLAWVKKGAAQEVPTRYTNEDAPERENPVDEVSDESMDEDLAAEAANNVAMDAESAAVIKKYNLDDYDNEDDGPCFVPPVFYQKGQKDPLLTDDGEEDEDVDDLRITSTDTVLVAATTEEDQFSHVNVYVYENSERNLYIHHDIVLPSFPLCIEWMEYHPPMDGESHTGTRNTIAVGTFQPEIEIWDLDLMDALVPAATLGGIEQDAEQAADVSDFARMSKAQKKKMKRKMLERAAQRTLREGSHTDAVMSLSWNTNVPNVLASGSADRALKIWDMNTQKCLSTYKHHTEKVQACSWHPTESNLLLSAGYDKSAAIVDIRTPGELYRWNLSADVEKVEWNPHRTQEFLVSSEDGMVKKFDSLAPSETLFTLHAHSAAVSGLSLNKVVPNCLATCSEDKSFKIWDITNNQPSMIFESDSSNAQLFALSWDRNSPHLLAVGGKEHLQVVDISKVEVVVKRFSMYSENNKSKENEAMA